MLGCELLSATETLRALVSIVYFALRLGLSDVVLNFAGHSGESSLDVLALLSGGLKEADSVVVGHLETLIEADDALVLQIGLVTNEDARDVILSVLLNLAHPSVHCAEGVTVRDIVGDDDAVGALVVGRGNRLKALLAGRIPDLQLAYLLVHIDRADLEVHADRRHEVLLELIILKNKISISNSMLTVKKTRLLTANLRRRQDLPTPELPIISTLKR